jgi:hypothetical protein
MDGRFLDVNKGDLAGVMLGRSGMSGFQGWAAPKPTWLVVRRRGRQELRIDRRDLELKPDLSGVRASIVAGKPGNAGGAKGRRKVET